MSPLDCAASLLPNHLDMKSLRRAAAQCEGCDLFKNATQTVFGGGADSAKLLIVGEQPGDQEDIAGEPEVPRGPVRVGAGEGSSDSRGVPVPGSRGAKPARHGVVRSVARGRAGGGRG